MGTDKGRGGHTLAALALFLVAAAQYAWNAVSVPPLTGYDAPAHAANIFYMVENGWLPQPHQGWSTWHPPFYYLLGTGVWTALDPLGTQATIAGLRAINGIAALMMGWVAYVLVARLSGQRAVAWCAAAIVLFVPTVQMAAAMVGNEALSASLGAGALFYLLRLQRDPGNLNAAAGAGLLAGLAVATKYSGIFVVVACAVPFARLDLDRRALRSLAAVVTLGALIAGPVYARNIYLTGTPVPMARTYGPTKAVEDANTIRPRRIVDYLWLNPACLLRPSIHHVAGEPGPPPRRNLAMTNIWGLVHASTWYDAFGHRIPLAFHRDGVIWGPALATLGLIPALILLLGFASCLRESFLSRFRSETTPVVVMWIVGLCGFFSFSWIAPSLVAVKSSYMLPLVVPGAIFFGRGMQRTGGPLRPWVLAASVAPALIAAFALTESLTFPTNPDDGTINRWRLVGRVVPDSYITETLDHLFPQRAPTQ